MTDKTQKERLLIFANSRSYTQKDLEKIIGISNGTLCHAKTDLTKYVQKKVFAAFPELSRDWLLHGTGDMLNGTTQTFNITMGDNSPQSVGDGNTLISGDASARVRALEAENAKLRQQIAKLEGMVEVYKGMLEK